MRNAKFLEQLRTKFVCFTSGKTKTRTRGSVYINKEDCLFVRMDPVLDKDVEIMFSALPTSNITRDKLRVRLSPEYNRKAMPEKLEGEIQKVWISRQKENPRLWNGTKFRIDEAHEENGCVTFDLGITCYKDFLGTNWSPKAKEILQLGTSDLQNSHAYMSDALGVGALVETCDHYAILLKRSDHCAEAVGLYDIPGGHPEPKV